MNSSDVVILEAIIGTIVLITFFVIAFRLKKIMNCVEVLADLEVKKPENRRTIKCEKCEKDFTVNILKRSGTINCPHCKAINRLTA